MTYLPLLFVVIIIDLAFLIGINAVGWRKALIDPELLYGPVDGDSSPKRSNVTIPQLNLSVSLKVISIWF